MNSFDFYKLQVSILLLSSLGRNITKQKRRKDHSIKMKKGKEKLSMLD